MRMPPNSRQPERVPRGGAGFNEGRHAHAAESRQLVDLDSGRSGFNEGRHAHAAESATAPSTRSTWRQLQ